jgi:glycosyltransferase involved in cell wall biosynthesis
MTVALFARRRPIRVLELRCADGPGGGPEKTILLGAARTDHAHFQVTVCYVRDRHDDDDRIRARAESLGIDFIEIKQRRGCDWHLWRETRRVVADRGIDLVHGHDYKSNLLALALARTGGVIPLATAHGWTGHAWRERFLYYPVDKRVLSRFPQIIAVSGQIRTELLRAGARPTRVTIVPNGIDHRVFRRDPERVPALRARFGVRPGETAVGAVGRLEPQKRFDLLLEAFAVVRQRRAGLRLLIAGEGSQRQALAALATRLGLGDSCRLMGHCSSVVDLHHALDVFVQSSGYEGTPNVVLEAMALETPVVATDVGGTCELICHGVHGLLVPPRAAAALAGALEQTLAHRDATARRTAAARARVEGPLSFTGRMRVVESIYEQLVARYAHRERGQSLCHPLPVC